MCDPEPFQLSHDWAQDNLPPPSRTPALLSLSIKSCEMLAAQHNSGALHSCFWLQTIKLASNFYAPCSNSLSVGHHMCPNWAHAKEVLPLFPQLKKIPSHTQQPRDRSDLPRPRSALPNLPSLQASCFGILRYSRVFPRESVCNKLLLIASKDVLCN